jgi:hypothetical protein
LLESDSGITYVRLVVLIAVVVGSFVGYPILKHRLQDRSAMSTLRETQAQNIKFLVTTGKNVDEVATGNEDPKYVHSEPGLQIPATSSSILVFGVAPPGGDERSTVVVSSASGECFASVFEAGTTRVYRRLELLPCTMPNGLVNWSLVA